MAFDEPLTSWCAALMGKICRTWLKRIEHAGRNAFLSAIKILLRVKQEPIAPLAANAKVCVVRLDARLGNVVMLTPLLNSLRLRLLRESGDDARPSLTLVAEQQALACLRGHPAIDRLWPFSKWSLLRRKGPLGTLLAMRREHFDVVIDASNPTAPSLTQALLVRLSGAKRTIGFAARGLGPIYAQPVQVPKAPHEIDKRLALLAPLGHGATVRTMTLGPLTLWAADAHKGLWDGPHMGQVPSVVLNIGARLPYKQLKVEIYAAIARRILNQGLLPILCYGPNEYALARKVSCQALDARLVPPSDVASLALHMHNAQAVISCDTGPMHLAVALGRPTCAIFVATPPERYGHVGKNNVIIDARHATGFGWLGDIDRFLQPWAATPRTSWAPRACLAQSV